MIKMEMKCVLWLASLTVLTCLLKHHLASAQRLQDYCYETDPEKRQTRHFSTKTAYQIAHGVDQRKYYNVPSKIKRFCCIYILNDYK